MCDCLEGVKLNGKNVNDVIFFDTELIITKVWFLHKYGSCPAFVEEAIRKYPMDVYLLCYPDLRWEADPVRENPDIREYLFRWYEKEIQTLGIPYYIVRHD
jgi:nicotinamide riboside kinase